MVKMNSNVLNNWGDMGQRTTLKAEEPFGDLFNPDDFQGCTANFDLGAPLRDQLEIKLILDGKDREEAPSFGRIISKRKKVIN